MAKSEGWKKGVGPYSNPNGEDPIDRRVDRVEGSKDISRTTEANQAVNGDASGPLKPARE